MQNKLRLASSLAILASVFAAATPAFASTVGAPKSAGGYIIVSDPSQVLPALRDAEKAAPNADYCVVGAPTPNNVYDGAGHFITGGMTLQCNFPVTSVQFAEQIDYSPTGDSDWNVQNGTYNADYGNPSSLAANQVSNSVGSVWKCIGNNPWYYRMDGVAYTAQLGISPEAVSHNPLFAYC